MFKYLLLSMLFLNCSYGWCHIGSINTVYDMDSGSYPIRVIITPSVGIPGYVNVIVKPLGEKEVPMTSATALPVRSDVDPENQPVPFKLEPIAPGSDIFSGAVFLNSIGSYQMIIQLDGEKGKTQVSVPFNAALMTAPKMDPFFLMFVISGVSLSLLILTLAIHKIFKEGHLSPGQTPTLQDIRRGNLAYFGVALVFLGTSLYLYNLGSQQIQALYKKKFHPPTLLTKIEKADKDELLFLTIQPNDQWREALPQNPLEDGFSPMDQRLDTHLVPDHGKFMHLFLIDLNKKTIAHLHPQKIGEGQFETLLPKLPAGTYDIFADITNESGFALTLTSRLTLPGENVPQASKAISEDPDDSWWISSEKQSPYQVKMREPQRFIANEDVTMIFEVVDEIGKPVELEPYMGMLSHAAIVNEDGTTFAHIHPNGTSSMAAIQLIDQKNNERSKHLQMIPKDQTQIRLPFVFPASGKYYLWVQYKVNNKVETTPFIIHVQ